VREQKIDVIARGLVLGDVEAVELEALFRDEPRLSRTSK
jgi:hypothetical protein